MFETDELNSTFFQPPFVDITGEIPKIDEIPENVGTLNFRKVVNVAQYKNADWSKVVGIARNISKNDAFAIANDNPKITYFFRTKGFQMVLEKKDGTARIFKQGDTVFFSGKPWWGEAKGFADGFVKN